MVQTAFLTGEDRAADRGGETTPSAGGLIEVSVHAIRDAARDIRIYDLRGLDGAALPSAEPGAHIDVHLPGGLARQYSLLNSGPAPHRYLIGVKRQDAGRGGSRRLHDVFAPGATALISAPRNHFPLDETAAHSVLIGGGVGVTPLWSMAARLAELGRPWSMHYFCRSQDAAIRPEEMSAHQDRVQLVFSGAPGRPTIAAVVDAAPPQAHLYCCGPLSMLKAFEAATAHLPPERVHVEYFSTDADLSRDGGFSVELARSGRVVRVPPGTTIVEALREVGVDVLTSCTEGYCGTCETAVLAGAPDHRDVVLTKAEKAAGRTMMVCCSRSFSSRLVLDL